MKKVLVALGFVLVVAGLVAGALVLSNPFSSVAPAAQDPVKEQQAQHQAQQFLTQHPSATTTQSQPATVPLVADKTFAAISIPAIGVEYPVGEGVSLHLLRTSVGHYTGTAQPGQIGNVGLGGHDCCREHGSPFANLSKLKAGDEVILTTATGRYVYTVIPMPSCGQDIPLTVNLNRIDVLNSAPCQNLPATRKLVTLTTCTPNGPNPTPWRLIVWAELKS